MTGVALLIVFVVFIPAMGVYANAFTAVWYTSVANKSLAHASFARGAFHTYSFKFISDRTSGSDIALYGHFLTAGLGNGTSKSKFDNLSMSDVRIRVMLSLNKLSTNL